MRPATLESTEIASPRDRKGFGERGLWELWLLDEAEEVLCGSIRTFLYYLCSKGTKHCEIHKANPLATASIDIRLKGPLADDEHNHSLIYRLTRNNVVRLKEAEKDLLVSGLIKYSSPPEDDKANQKVRQALTALGVPLR